MAKGPTIASDRLKLAIGGDAEALAEITNVLRDGRKSDIARIASTLDPVEAAQLIMRLRPKAARRLLSALADTPSLSVLDELAPDISAQLLGEEQAKRLAKIVAKLPPEDAADMLADAPPRLVEATLDALGHPTGLVDAVSHHDETAGAFMRRRLVAVPIDWTIGQVIDEIRANSARIDRIYAVYVTDRDRKLVGYLKIRDLLLNSADRPVRDVVRTDVVLVTSETDRLEAARIAKKRQLPVLPVVDSDGRLVGRVTARELRAIDEAEAGEDLKLMSGVAPDSSSADGPLRIVPRRLPWLSAGLIGAGIAAFVVGAYEDALVQAAILASLIPVVMSLAGNAGIQAATVTVQAQASGAFWAGDIWGRLLREIGGAVLNGGIVGSIVAFAILALSLFVGIRDAPLLAITALLTLTLVTLQASAVGSMVPVLLDKLGFDPAVATGVFITTSNDVVGVLIFFTIATAIYL